MRLPGTGRVDRRGGSFGPVAVAGLVLAGLAAACSGSGSGIAVDPVVRVSGIACSQPTAGVGYLIGANRILTSGHVVDAVTEVEVLFGGEQTADATVTHIDRMLDLAIVDLVDEAERFEPETGPAEFGDSSTGDTGSIRLLTEEGDHVDVSYEVIRRIVASTLDVGRENEIRRRSVQLEAVVERGDSGAPMIDSEGRLVGVVWATSVSQESTAYAVRGDEIAAVIDAADAAPSGPGSC